VFSLPGVRDEVGLDGRPDLDATPAPGLCETEEDVPGLAVSVFQRPGFVAVVERPVEESAGTGPTGTVQTAVREGDAGRIGRRALTAGLDLDGRSFLHSYDPTGDPDGDALEAIMTGPMVVTQWINSQYYFATVDTAVYGSGSKVTHNPVGNVGVYQGNGGDLMTGLPVQSVLAADDDPYHQPLRLSVVIDAPVERVTDVVAGHDHLKDLLDNRWLTLTVVDPEQGFRAFHYDGDLTWTTLRGEEATAPGPAAPPEPLAED
jgi:hypothetical protein